MNNQLSQHYLLKTQSFPQRECHYYILISIFHICDSLFLGFYCVPLFNLLILVSVPCYPISPLLYSMSSPMVGNDFSNSPSSASFLFLGVCYSMLILESHCQVSQKKKRTCRILTGIESNLD